MYVNFPSAFIILADDQLSVPGPEGQSQGSEIVQADSSRVQKVSRKEHWKESFVAREHVFVSEIILWSEPVLIDRIASACSKGQKPAGVWG